MGTQVRFGDRLIYLLGAMGLLQLTDGLMTYYMVSRGLATELNPLVSSIAGDIAFPFLKIAGALLCIVALWLVSKRFRLLAFGAAAVVVVWYAVALGWNVHSLLVAA